LTPEAASGILQITSHLKVRRVDQKSSGWYQDSSKQSCPSDFPMERSLFPDLDGEGDAGFRIDVRPWGRAIANRGFPAMSQGYEYAQCGNFRMFPVISHKTS
jgi:hypothetical protein